MTARPAIQFVDTAQDETEARAMLNGLRQMPKTTTPCQHPYIEQVIPLRGPRVENSGYRGSSGTAYTRCQVCHKTIRRGELKEPTNA